MFPGRCPCKQSAGGKHGPRSHRTGEREGGHGAAGGPMVPLLCRGISLALQEARLWPAGQSWARGRDPTENSPGEYFRVMGHRRSMLRILFVLVIRPFVKRKAVPSSVGMSNRPRDLPAALSTVPSRR